jgi:cytochrome P450
MYTSLQTLRMDGPAQNTLPRQSSRDTELAGTFIPKGASLIADMFVMHHDPAVWKDPEAFIPERFGPGGESESKAGQGLSWAPFGSGSRQCIGKSGVLFVGSPWMHLTHVLWELFSL